MKNALSTIACGLVLTAALPVFTSSLPARQVAGNSGAGPALERVVRVGARLTTGARGARGVTLSMPVPTDWPEQHVAMFEENLPGEVRRSEYRESETIRQFVATLPQIAGRTTVDLEILFEVTVQPIARPERTDHLVVPVRPPRDVRLHLQPSEMIESRDPAIRKQAESIVADHATAWGQVEAIYDWVTSSIIVDPAIRKETGAAEAVEQLKGSPEDLSYAFIALCRSQKIPARVVWADGGEYAEFYLQDDSGEGQWYPAVLEGKPEFGQMTNPRVILQKGDNIKVPERQKRMLFVTSFITGSGSMGEPRWICDVLPARDAD